jgi:rSAM/selenodomain-associated transferase 1
VTPDVTVCVFAKPPRPGDVNTRLAPAVGLEGAAKLARAFFEDTLSLVSELPWATTVIASTDPWPTPLPETARTWPQGDGDLGARMERVLRRALTETPAALALGVDSPGLPRARLEEARAVLLGALDPPPSHPDRAVLGPCEDGGFYTLGLTRCRENLLAELPWSAADTFDRTRNRLVEFDLELTALRPWFDIDTPADLERLRARIEGGEIDAPHTARALVNM